MSKRTRYGDNSKRKQPTQRRAQARQPGNAGPSRSESEPSPRQGESESGKKRS